MIGTTIGKYRIVERLGRGGMGTVYKAIDETLDREVAVKVLNSDVDDSTLMARFRAEAKTVARLNHPQIATIYEIYRSDTDLLMVMELVRGETLDKLSARIGPLPPEQAASMVVQVLGALGHAHRAGIVHRDLKPANLMITESGTVKVMDFGIARVLGAEHLTMDGMLMGTPAYMAPEQVMGNDVDARTDLYSVGVVFYRLLTGCLPFQADTPIAIVRKQLSEEPTPLSAYRTDLPEWCQTILTRALAKEAAERFQNADEFRTAIVSAIGHSNVPMGVFGSEYLPAPNVPPATLAAKIAASAPPQPTDAERAALSQAPTLVGEPTPIPAPNAPAQPRHAALEATAIGRTQAGAGSLDETVLAPSIAASLEETKLAPALEETRLAPAPVQSASTSRPRGSRTGVYVAAAAAIVIVVGVAAMMMRGGTSAPVTTTASSESASSTSAPETNSAPVAPAEPTAARADTAGGTASADPTAPAGAPAEASAQARAIVPPTGTAAPGAAGRRGATPAVAPTSAARATPLEPSPPAAAADAAAVTTAATAPALPPLLFEAQTVVVEDGRNRQRETKVQVGNGTVTVTDKDDNVVTTMPFASVVGFTYSNSRQPLWNSPQGPAEIVHIDGGAFGFLRGDQHWVSLRTDRMSLVLRVRDQESRRIVLGIEERLGRKVETVGGR
jgi:serine/threonine-protein kinase